MQVIWEGDDSVFDVIGEDENHWIVVGDDIEGEYMVHKSQCVILSEDECDSILNLKTEGPVKSDGGSSSYYKLTLPKWLIEKIVKDGAIETEDVIEVVFGNDFDYGNIFKSLVRAYKTEQGCGKMGNDVAYDISKVEYSCLKIKQLSGRR